MNNFLKELMKLATELNQANGFDAVVVINEMELLYDKHAAELKNLAIHDVSNQRKLLFAFVKYLQKENAVDSAIEYYIEDFLSKQ